VKRATDDVRLLDFLIIGGGFVGTALACHLLRESANGSSIALLNSGTPLARGLAYGTQSPYHLLNVPAARMAWHPERPDDFVDWLRNEGHAASGGDFVSRQHYGNYLSQRLQEHIAAQSSRLIWSHQVATVNALQSVEGGWQASLADGQRLCARRVVLALGNFTPACPHADLMSLDHGHYQDDPWKAGATSGLEVDDPIAVIGSGLTMLDLLTTLQQQGHRGPVLCLSRRGLPPQPHRSNELPPPNWHAPDDWLSEPTLLARLRGVRQAAKDLMADGGDWRDILVALRPRTPQLWISLSLRDRKRFLQHLQPYWDTHRHRAAPLALRTLEEAHLANRLRVVSGRLMGAYPAKSGVHLQWKERGTRVLHTGEFVRVFNCTGPSTRPEADRTGLLGSMARNGQMSPCPHGLGLLVDDQYRMLDAHGRPQHGLYYVGPMLRAQYWEATAVTELRQHALAALRSVLGKIPGHVDRCGL